MLFRHGLASGHCHPSWSGSRHPEQTRLALASHGLSGSNNMEEAKLVAEFPAGFCSLGLISSLREQVGMERGSVTIEVATKQSMKPPLPRLPVWCLPKEGCFTVPLQPLKTAHLCRTVSPATALDQLLLEYVLGWDVITVLLSCSSISHFGNLSLHRRVQKNPTYSSTCSLWGPTSQPYQFCSFSYNIEA